MASHRGLFCLSLAFALLAGTSSLCAAEFPYFAYVNTTNVYLRSGPGQDYYPTDKLQKGERVEVYRHDPGGWYAIRPTRQSFSWISKRHVEPAGDGLAVVTMPKAVSRVGSTFSDVRDVIQVRLDKGEKVELLGETEPEAMWCKIAPPAGEFRWVFSKYLDREPPADVARGEQEVYEGRTTGAVGALPGHPGVGAERDSQVEAYAFEQEVNRLELELSAIVAADISAWNFEELQRRAQEALNRASTPLARGQVRVLLNKLARFEEVRQRHEQLRSPENPGYAGAAGPRPADYSKYDGVGRLAPVISDKVGGPQYALVDQSNAVISFVTPAPGVNLRPYVDRFVGVNGQRGYLAELQRQHINVQRVSVLDDGRVRR